MKPCYSLAIAWFASVCYLSIAFLQTSSISKPSLPHRYVAVSRLRTSSSTHIVADEDSETQTTDGWATHALLFSSWTDGVASNNDTRSFLKYALLRKMLRDNNHRYEDEVKTSVEFSPCNGPDVHALNCLEMVDELIEREQLILRENRIMANDDAFNKWSDDAMDYLLSVSNGSIDLRFLYIPTAMYALNPQSSNTPGKQRQRARADGKKRRDQVTNVIDELFNAKIQISAITLDLDDGSLKQAIGFSDQESIPKYDITALSDWNPHIIYVEGGNTFWLQHCIEKRNYTTLILNACTGSKGAVYAGKSAGAIVAGRYLETATWKGWDDPSVVPDKASYGQWIGCKGFGFAGDQSYFPHYSSEWDGLVKEKTKSWPMTMNSTEILYEDGVCCVVGELGRRFVLRTADETSIF